ncbi:uncharacterized protein LOC130993676 isoform X2 [Salvia miltiorrhiza]|uniref:uncharacterized protein LOC130993676 isoform X2 n=1 Tax=Salvia miltiorrhiza TaxID=226208 RepID=UPI0025ACFBBA|nr:uncharacterized protein LOC130993676 isoform X2 [Salvia miltiorrhiza]
MGNCQAVEAAALVIQHPCGKLERMYWPLSATDVMKANPGHYVSLIIPLTIPGADNRYTRVKLLRPTDKLLLEVMKVVRAKKHAKMKKNMSESGHLQDSAPPETNRHHEGATHRQRPTVGGGGRPKSWRPSLQSISEASNN